METHQHLLSPSPPHVPSYLGEHLRSEDAEYGVDAVLEGVAMYKSKDPNTPDEEEMLENLFDCLCCLLMPLENRERFVNGEGVELMIITMKQKKYAYGSAVRALDFAMTNYPPACERFVDDMGQLLLPSWVRAGTVEERVISLEDVDLSVKSLSQDTITQLEVMSCEDLAQYL